jgi:A/G-specific adenine glycosylase
MQISELLLSWYASYQRYLPWRETKDPYRIWISEIILQQTRVSQGLDYYNRFVERFPDIESLAAAGEDSVLKIWQGLGYYSRARHLHETAKTICTNRDAQFPKTYDELIKLKGIGPYTAAAIASIAFNQAVPVVDGNVYRVLSRLYGIDLPVNSTDGMKMIRKLAGQLLDHSNPGLFNQAIMEFGAIHCTVNQPNCKECPLADRCIAHEKNMVTDLPVPKKTVKKRALYFNYIVPLSNTNTLLRRRSGKTIWEGLYEFPLLETNGRIEEHSLVKSDLYRSITGNATHRLVDVSEEFRHVLSHRTIFARFYLVNMSHIPDLAGSDFLSIDIKELHKFAVPRLIEKYLLGNPIFLKYS